MDETAASWTPNTADERNYYDTLFRLADVSNVGNLAGQPAVTFLARSRLSFPILKQARSTVVRIMSNSLGVLQSA